MDTTKDRFREMLSRPGAIRRIFDRLEIEAASLPYYPEMLNFELPENVVTEHDEITLYRSAFAGVIRREQ